MAKDDKAPTLEEKLDQALSVIKEQGEKLAALEAANKPAEAAKKETFEPPKETVSVDGNKYKFTVGRYIDSTGNTVLAKDMLKNPAELERLVLIKSGIFVKV